MVVGLKLLNNCTTWFIYIYFFLGRTCKTTSVIMKIVNFETMHAWHHALTPTKFIRACFSTNVGCVCKLAEIIYQDMWSLNQSMGNFFFKILKWPTWASMFTLIHMWGPCTNGPFICEAWWMYMLGRLLGFYMVRVQAHRLGFLYF